MLLWRILLLVGFACLSCCRRDARLAADEEVDRERVVAPTPPERGAEPIFCAKPSDLEITFFGSREQVAVESLHGRPETLGKGDVVHVGTWAGRAGSWADLEASVRRKGLAVPMPVVGDGATDFHHLGDPDLVYETWQGTTRLVGAHLRVDGDGSRAPWGAANKAVRSLRVSAADPAVPLDGFDALQLVEIERRRADASGVEGWLAQLPQSVEYLILRDATGASLADLPENLVYLEIGLAAGSESQFEQLPSMRRSRWLRLSIYRERIDHGIVVAESGLFGELFAEDSKAAPSESRVDVASLLGSRFASLRSLDIHLDGMKSLEFTSQLTELVQLVIREGGELELDDLAEHPRLEQLQVVNNRSWRLPSRPNTRMRRVMLETLYDDDQPARAAFPNAMVLAKKRDRLHYAMRCADEWLVRPARQEVQREHEPRGLRVPPVAVVRDPEQLSRLASRLEQGLGAAVPGKHFTAGDYPMVDFYRSGRLLGFISIHGTACEAVYIPGEGIFELEYDVGVELCQLFDEPE